MKRRPEDDAAAAADGPLDLHGSEISTRKKNKAVEDGEEDATAAQTLGEDLVFEVLRHADARTLARAACVSRQWRRTAEDERLWEGVCTRDWANMGCGVRQLRSVVLALGGFRRLHSLYLRPLHQPSSSSSSSSSLLPIMPFSAQTTPIPSLPSSSSLGQKKVSPRVPAKWGKDEQYKEWILGTIEQTWNLFHQKFISIWDENKDGHGEAYLPDIYNTPELLLLVQKKYMTDLFHDTLGFGAAKMIRD